MRVFHRTSALAGTIAIGLVVAGCGAPEPSPTIEPNTLTQSVALEGEFDPDAEFTWANSDGATSWDPTQSTTGFDMAFLMPVYDRLVYAAPDGSLEPMLAESWESTDDTTLTFKLRPDLTFSDGTPFTAEAVKINLERAMSPDSKLNSYISTIAAVEVVDELTIKLTVSEAMGAVLTEMSARPGMMASPKAIADGTLTAQPVGIGPYIATEVVPGGTSVTFEKTPNYWDPDAQRVATMHFQQVADDQTRLNGFLTGEFDSAVIRPNHVDAALKDDHTVVSGVSPTFSYMVLNTGIEPLDDPQVRLALNLAIDRVGIGEGLWQGYCTPGVQPFPETSFAYNTDIGDGLDEWAYDPEKATQILADAGYPDGFSMTIVAGNVTVNTATAEALQSQLGEIGVDVQIEVLPTAPLIEAFVVDKTAGAMVATAGATEDPHVVLQTYVLPDARFNPGATLTDEMTNLADQAATPLDGPDRAAAYSEFMDLWMETPPNLLSICMARSLLAVSDDVMGVSSTASGFYDFRGMAVKKD